MMIITKGGGATASPSPKAEHHTECCMCGDLGLSSELFRCKICHFRSQHRYCSNIYPRAESYRACNWCLSDQKEGSPEKTQNSVNSSSSNRSTSDRDDLAAKTKKKINVINNNINVKGSSLKVSVNNRSIKKHKSSPSPSPESQRSPMMAARKRITTAGDGGGGMKKDNLRRTKSDIPKSVVYKHGFRNIKVRRYKLLDEVST